MQRAPSGFFCRTDLGGCLSTVMSFEGVTVFCSAARACAAVVCASDVDRGDADWMDSCDCGWRGEL